MTARFAARAPALAFAFLAPFILCADGAHADSATANACAAQLPKDARTIFDTTLPELTPNANLRSLVVANTRKLALAGTISRDTARQSAIAAAKCLRLAGD